jgi:hypothetical protein
MAIRERVGGVKAQVNRFNAFRVLGSESNCFPGYRSRTWFGGRLKMKAHRLGSGGLAP